MKKAYIIHLSGVNFSNEGILHGFRDAGYLVRSINHQDYIRNPAFGLRKFREKVISDVREWRPDVVFMQPQKSDVIDIPTAQKLQEVSRVVNYTFDVRDAGTMKWMYELAPYISMSCFSNEEDILQCQDSVCKIREDLGGMMVLWSSCDMEFYRKAEPKTEYPEVIFIGNNYEKSLLNFPHAADRQRMVEFLESELGERFMAFGLGQKGGFLTPEQERDAYNSAKIVIAQNNYRRNGYTSDRTWRATASGAFLLQEYWEGMPIEFHAIWSNFEELIKNIHFYLAHPKIREDIARQDMEYVRANHAYKNRVEELESKLFEAEFRKSCDADVARSNQLQKAKSTTYD